MPGGVSSPVRDFRAVGGVPIFAVAGRGAYLFTTDGRSLVDFCMSFGPLILGHGHPEVVEAASAAVRNGTSFGVTTEAEIELAELIREAIPSIEKIRLVNSGTEAVMTAIRLARGVTGRSKILKFTGCYHGHSDSLLVEAGSGVAGIARASSAGVPDELARCTIVAPYNDPAAVTGVVRAHGEELAAIAVEPVAGNMGVILPEEGFLEQLRKLADECGALLLFDEVITGFRLHFGGYQQLCGVTPDLTCLGKVIGGGMPIGAVGGRAEIMDHLTPGGDVYQAGTLSGNPVSVAAGLATLRALQKLDPYAALEERTRQLVEEIRGAGEEAGVPLYVPQVGSLFNLFFTPNPVRSFADVMQCDRERYARFFHAVLEQDVYLPPSPFEACFASVAHEEATMEKALQAFRKGLQER